MQIIYQLLQRFLGLVVSNGCLACGSELRDSGLLCTVCWLKLNFITEPFCHLCGLPNGILENNCTCKIYKHKLSYKGVRSVFIYEGLIRKLILDLKYHNQLHVAKFLSSLMSVFLHDKVKETCNLIVPVPLHNDKLRQRGYNQAWELAKGMHQNIGVPASPNLLRRLRSTGTQAGLTFSERSFNVDKAFAISNPEILRGRSVALIDDIVTTGATANACSEALLQAGAESVWVFSLARAHKDDDIAIAQST